MDEWLVDETGKRYRMRGNIKEYEMMVTVGDGISIPESRLAEYNRMKEKNAERQREDQRPAATMKSCPFKNGINATCRADCMLWTPHGCSIIYLVGHAPKMARTEGRSCPFNPYMCKGANCELWSNGCVFTAI